MGTDKGISRYDMKADTFTNFSPFIDSAFSKLTIAPFWATKDEMYCMEPGGAITAINIHTLKREKILQAIKDARPGNCSGTQTSLFLTKAQTVFGCSTMIRNAALEQIFLRWKNTILFLALL